MSSQKKTNIKSEISDNEYNFTEVEDGDEDDDDDDEETSEGEDDVINSDSGSEEEFFTDELDFDYMADVVKSLEDHADVNMENSIALNRKLQDKLEEFRRKIILMLNKCREMYQENQTKLENPSAITSYLKGIGSCGRPFFKDKAGRSCPPNADYIYRSEVEKEFFPSDLELFPHFTWTARDRVGILQGIKEQAIDYIERKDSYKQKSTKSTPLSKKVKLHSLKINKLLEKVDDDFDIDWNQISVYNLNSRHTANSCFASWNAYLKPEISRDEWTDEENTKLNELAKKHQFQDWIAIASEMPHRSDYQCFVQYQTVVAVKLREDKGERWTKEEDETLLSLVEQNRMGNVIRWNPICSQLPNRTKKQCFARWKYSINPNISRALFTPEEDCIILAAVEEFGENFNCFPKELFPNRTVVQIRNRYNNSIKSRGTIKHWSPEEDRLLLDLIAKYGEHDWKNISESIKYHTRTSCRTRYLTIAKFFKENPNATIENIPRKKRRSRSNVNKDNWVATITESISEPIEEIIEESYRSKLRQNDLNWYNFLKYSYDYKFGEGYSQVPKYLVSLEFVRYVFECNLSLPIVLQRGYSKSFVAVTLTKLVRLHYQDDKSLVFERPNLGFKLPPSYCSLLAFRGLCIQASFSDNQDKSVTIKNQLPANAIEARKKFRQRLISLLYNTTLLSRLEPRTSVEHNTFEVIFDTRTQLGQAAGINLAEIKVAQMNKIAENLRIAQEKADNNRKYKEKVKRKQNDKDMEITTVTKNNKQMPEFKKPKQKKAPAKKQKISMNELLDIVNKTTLEKEKQKRQNEEISINVDSSCPAIISLEEQPTEIIIDLENASQSKALEKPSDCTKELVDMPSLAVTEDLTVNETLGVINSIKETKQPSKYKSFATQKANNRKRTFDESFVNLEESSTFELKSEINRIKREKE